MQSVCDSVTNTHLQFVSYSLINWKFSNVIPLYKSNDPMFFSRYWPVALLSVLSKVFEKIMYERIVAFLNANNILYKFQFSFRPKYSPYLALITLIEQGKSEGFESCDRPIVRKRPIWVKIGDVLSRVTLKFDGWPWKTIGHLSFAVSSFVQHFIAIGELKLELLSGNAQSGSNLT